MESQHGSLVLVRHGQSHWNLENRFTGWVDIGITEHGEYEARCCGTHLQHLRFDLAYTSNLQRAQQTLQVILKTMQHPEIPIEKHAALNERHYGDLQGLNKAEMVEKHGEKQVQLWRRSYHVQPPGGESLHDTVQRVKPYLYDRILPSIKGKKVLLVAHGNSIRAISMLLEEIHPDEIVKLEIGHCTPIVYHFHDDGRIHSKESIDVVFSP